MEMTEEERRGRKERAHGIERKKGTGGRKGRKRRGKTNRCTRLLTTRTSLEIIKKILNLRPALTPRP